MKGKKTEITKKLQIQQIYDTNLKVIRVLQVTQMLRSWTFLTFQLQLKDTEPLTKNSLIGLLSELRGFKFVTALV